MWKPALYSSRASPRMPGRSRRSLGKEDFIISDELNHASIIDGARLSRAKIKVFRHKDAAHAEEQLESIKNEPGHKLVITDGVFSMDGDIGALPELTALAEKYGAIMMVDDAHSSGVLGRNGRGTIDHFGLHGRVDIQVGTLSKAIGALGGYVCGSRDLIEFLYHRGRPFLFSTSHPPSVAATCRSRPSTFWSRNRSASRICGRTRATGSRSWARSASTSAESTPPPVRRRSRRSSSEMGA